MITIQLSTEANQYDAEARHDLALYALASALLAVSSSVTPAWTVRPASSDDPLLYHLTPLQEDSVSSAAAWDMTYALRSQPQVTKAHPTFTTRPHDRRARDDTP